MKTYENKTIGYPLQWKENRISEFIFKYLCFSRFPFFFMYKTKIKKIKNIILYHYNN